MKILGHKPQPIAVPKRVFYLPSGYKKKTNVVVKGRASTGEASLNGLVKEEEDWEGRQKATVAPNALRYKLEPDGTIRPMTVQEQVERGYFVPGEGPTGLRL